MEFYFDNDIEKARGQFMRYVTELFNAAADMNTEERKQSVDALLESWFELFGGLGRKSIQPSTSWMKFIPQQWLDKLYSVLDHEYWVNQQSNKINQRNAYHTDRQTKRFYSKQYPTEPEIISEPLAGDEAGDMIRPARRQREQMYRYTYSNFRNMHNVSYGLFEVTYILKFYKEIEQDVITRSDYNGLVVLMDFGIAMDEVLTPYQRECLGMWQEGHTHVIIGKRQGKSAENVRKAIDRAIKNVHGYLQNGEVGFDEQSRSII